MPVAPVRLLDTRATPTTAYRASSSSGRREPSRSPTAAASPPDATAITGNLTVTDETAGWAIYVGPAPLAAPNELVAQLRRRRRQGQRRVRRSLDHRHSLGDLPGTRRRHHQPRLRRHGLLREVGGGREPARSVRHAQPTFAVCDGSTEEAGGSALSSRPSAWLDDQVPLPPRLSEPDVAS